MPELLVSGGLRFDIHSGLRQRRQFLVRFLFFGERLVEQVGDIFVTELQRQRPAMTSPVAWKREPWQGQSQVLSAVPVVYVNDNFGRWRSDFRAQVDRCIQDACPGSAVARLLIPEPDDYFVLKPKHSRFYSTALECAASPGPTPGQQH